MAVHDVEKESNSDSQNTAHTNNDVPQTKERTSSLLRPHQPYSGVALTPVASTRSQARSHLSRTRSYVDGHGTFFSDDGESDEEEREEEEQDPNKPFEVGWDGEEDSMNPRNLSTARKWAVVMTLAFGSLCVTCTSSLYTTTYDQMDAEFGNSRIVATLGLSLFVFGLGLSPMVLAPLSEFYGRRPIYVWSYIFFTIWLIPCAVSQNIQTMLIARFLDGFAGSAFLSVAGGTVGDMFAKHELQAPMMVYTASPFIGPGIGPILGGFINYNVNWRWSYYTLLIWSGVMTVAIAVLVPETYHPVLLRRKAQMKRKETGDERWKAPIEIMDRSIFWTVTRSLYRPFLLLTLEPMCLNLCLLSSILLGILYLFFGAFQLVLKNVYGFNLWQIGLSFLGLLIGMLTAIASDPIWHYNYLRLLRKKEQETGEPGKSEPEYRLPPSIFGVWLCVIGLFWFAWTIYPNIHWIVPLIGSAFFGCGTILTFTGVFTFLVEAYPLYAASALAANSFARSSFAGAFPLFGVQMYEKLGYHWATTLLACLTLAMAPFPYIFFRYGKKLRSKSKFTSKPS